MGKFSSSKLEHQLSQHDRRHMRINLEELSYVPLYDEFPRADYARNCNFVISFKMGWAIPVRTVPTIYSKRQTNYAKTLFLQGQETRGKYLPEEAEQVQFLIQSIYQLKPLTYYFYSLQAMRDVESNDTGLPYFEFSEWLSADQFK